jgi:phospholipase/carboxylesterase
VVQFLLMLTTATPDLIAKTGLHYQYELAPDPTAPLYLLVHGRAGNFQVMSTFRRAIPEGCTVILPQAPLVDPIGGFSWWQVAEATQEERFQHVESASAQLLEFLTKVEKLHHLKPTKRIAFGFSQGAALLSWAFHREPHTFAGIALLAGFIFELPFNKDLHLTLPQIFVAHGTIDDTVPVTQARRGVEYLKAQGLSVEYHEDEVGHKIGSAALRALKEWNTRF